MDWIDERTVLAGTPPALAGHPLVGWPGPFVGRAGQVARIGCNVGS